jgi:membrane protein YdbS with pleckstrin-like domain
MVDTAPSAPADDIADGRERHLDPRNVALGRLLGGIWVAALTAGLCLSVLIVIAAGLAGWIVLLVVAGGTLLIAAIGLASYFYPAAEHRHARWRLTGRGFEHRHGVVWRTVTNVPLTRIQHTDVSQGPLQKRFGLATLTLHTAGTAAAELTVAGLSEGAAAAIRDYLVRAHHGD